METNRKRKHLKNDTTSSPTIQKFWENQASFQPNLIDQYFPEVSSKLSRSKKFQDESYLSYLWNYFTPNASFAHIFSIVYLVNHLQMSRSTILETLATDFDKFKTFFDKVAEYGCCSSQWPVQQMTHYLSFCSHVFKLLENSNIRRSILRYLFLPMWESLNEVRRSQEFEKYPNLEKFWKTRQTQLQSSTPISNFDSLWFPSLVSYFFSQLQMVSEAISNDESSLSEPLNLERLSVLEIFLDFLSDLLSQLSTRRFLNTLLDGVHFSLRCHRSALYQSRSPRVALFVELVKMIDNSIHFEFNDQSGSPLTRTDLIRLQYEKTHKFQQIAYTHYRTQMRDMIFSSAGELSKPSVLLKHLSLLSLSQLQEFSIQFGLIPRKTTSIEENEESSTPSMPAPLFLDQIHSISSSANTTTTNTTPSTSSSSITSSPSLMNFDLDANDSEVLREALLSFLTSHHSQLEALNSIPLFPTEELLWDEKQIPSPPLHSTTSSTLETRDPSPSDEEDEIDDDSSEATKKEKIDSSVALTSTIASTSSMTTSGVFPLPKLNLSFLTVHDYLMRNFILYRLESSDQIREDVSDAVQRMGPRKSGLKGDHVTFGGWARMAQPILTSSIDEIGKPHIGELVPRHVHCTVTVDLSRLPLPFKQEWDSLREHDVVFLLCISNPQPEAMNSLQQFEQERNMLSQGKKPKSQRDFDRQHQRSSSSTSKSIQDFPKHFGIKFLRGGEIFEIRDEENNKLNDFKNPNPNARRENGVGAVGQKRRFRLKLDPTQYYSDLKIGQDCYESFNLIIRRDPKENNFKSILETIRDLMNTEALDRTLPTWLRDVFLGNGNPSSGNYRSLLSSSHIEELDMVDTFLDANHLRHSFPEANSIVVRNYEGQEVLTLPGTATSTEDLSTFLPPPYRLSITRNGQTKGIDRLTVQPYLPPSPGPYPSDIPPQNPVRFTQNQIEAIRSGMNPGLTLIVGPPGTGKTDTAVQMIANLYHSDPNRKILLVTHSNAALNDLFEKIMERNIDPRHCLRLGSGEKELRESLRGVSSSASSRIHSGDASQGHEKDLDFSKQGRVNWSLSRRLQLLKQVERLGASLGIPGDVGSTCETAEYFYLEHIQSRLEKFELDLSTSSSSTSIRHIFPFNGYFLDTSAPIFTDTDRVSDIRSARGCFQHIKKIFSELEDYCAFELLRTQGHRSDYLLIKQARIVAMTCTHAAMTRRQLLELDFRYDTLILEEAGQILEVETLIPMVLQKSEHVGKSTDSAVSNSTGLRSKSSSGEGSRLQRVILIGDHNQLPPVVQNQTLQRVCRLEQSLFSRFIRLGVPYILLDKQGRSRKELADLFSWRYSTGTSHLGHLEEVLSRPSFLTANAGFAHPFQFIHVPYFKGKGESCPTPYFYQNVGEAEYVVAVYQYFRLLGYPASKISIITSYNGQRSLIRDILSQRCRGVLFGMPSQVTTVDKFQGQQNDIILLSLVRTESIGHMRDVRRLVVALSRARPGLYIFGFKDLFEQCLELRPAMNLLFKRPSNTLDLVSGESYPTTRLVSDPIVPTSLVSIPDVTAMGVLVYQMTQHAQSRIYVPPTPPPMPPSAPSDSPSQHPSSTSMEESFPDSDEED